MKRKHQYPGVLEAEKQKSVKKDIVDEEPDFVGDKPNWEKFKGWPVEKVLVWLNID